MQKKLVVYGTGRYRTTEIMKDFCTGVNNSGTEWFADFTPITKFLNEGIQSDANAIATLGILRGTGLALQHAAKHGIDRYYIDHSYFNPGYDGKCWLRVSKNRHTINYFPNLEITNSRWETFFSDTNHLQTWRTRSQRGNNILVLPPTHAVQWYFNAGDWTSKITDKLKEILPAEQHGLIKVRIKPNEPIVDDKGNLLALDKHKDLNQVPLEKDLEDANIVVAYNSSVALQATMLGIPVITNNHCSVFPVSFTLDDLKQGTDNPKFDTEPARVKLVHWLSNCQYNRKEIKEGTMWPHILQHQEPVD